jgi:hypothetical protein
VNSQWILVLSRGVMTVLLDSMVRGMIVLLLAGGAVGLLARARAAMRHRLWLVAMW